VLTHRTAPSQPSQPSTQRVPRLLPRPGTVLTHRTAPSQPSQRPTPTASQTDGDASLYV
jgi:hypothetical protein